MKKIIITLSLIALIFVVAPESISQCDAERYTEMCIPKLMDGFNFVKSYKVNGEEGNKSKIEYSYVFAKGTQYYINLCNDGEDTDGMIVNIYDSNRKQVATSYANGNYYPGIIYPCNATGIYYITYTFKDSQNHCGGSVLGFKR
jgi:hypothetical protein